jgi:DNA-binding transcriptional LysR family regulator
MNTIPRIEFGLLAVLVAIEEAGTVSGAAGRLNLSQPAVSHALKRLRILTGNQLFTRVQGRMVPTARCSELVPEARRLVLDATRLLSPEVFDPIECHYMFRFAVNEYSMMTCLQPLLAVQSRVLPNSKLSAIWSNNRVYDALVNNIIDFSFSGDIQNAQLGHDVIAYKIFSESYVGVMRREHPLAEQVKEQKLTTRQWAAFPHVTFSTQSTTPSSVDKMLAENGLHRNTVVSSESHAFNLSVVAGSDQLYALPSRLVSMVDQERLVTFSLPLKTITFPFYVICAKRVNSVPALEFMRDLILETLKEE